MMGDRNTSSRSLARLVLSSVVFAVASLLSVAIHEFGHALMAVLEGFSPTVYGTLEQDVAGTRPEVVSIAAAGPLVSLVVGLLFLMFSRRQVLGWPRLFSVWMGLSGLITFAGYLATAPFFPGGDIGVVIDQAGLPSATTWAAFVLGAIGVVYVGKVALNALLPFTTDTDPLRPQLLALGVFTWLLGSIIVLVITLPWQYAAWPIAVLTTGFFTPLINLFATRLDPNTIRDSPPLEWKISPVLIVMLIVTAVLFQTVLRSGVTL